MATQAGAGPQSPRTNLCSSKSPLPTVRYRPVLTPARQSDRIQLVRLSQKEGRTPDGPSLVEAQRPPSWYRPVWTTKSPIAQRTRSSTQPVYRPPMASHAAPRAAPRPPGVGASRVPPRHAVDRFGMLGRVLGVPHVAQPRASKTMRWSPGTAHQPSSGVNVIFACVYNPETPGGPSVKRHPEVLDNLEIMLKSIVVFSPNTTINFHALVDRECHRFLTNLTRATGDWPESTLRGHPLHTVVLDNKTRLEELESIGTVAPTVHSLHGNFVYGLAAFAAYYAYALLPDLDFAVWVDLDVVFMQDIRFLWREFAHFNDQEVFGYTRQHRGRTELIFQRAPNVFDSYNAGVVLLNLAKWRQLVDAHPPAEMESSFKKYFNFDHGLELWCWQMVMNAYHYWYPQHVHVLPRNWNLFECCESRAQVRHYAESFIGAVHKARGHISVDFLRSAVWDAVQQGSLSPFTE